MKRTSRSITLAASCLVAAAAVLTAPNARAQTASAEQSGNGFSLPTGTTPTEIFGIPCKAKPGDADFAPSLQCFPAEMLKQPSIAVTVADWKSRPSRAEIIGLVRQAFHERPIFNVIREESFAPPGDPEAVGFRALYQTDLGNRYVWAVLSRGKMTRVTVIVFAPADFAAMTADVEWKVFGVPRP